MRGARIRIDALATAIGFSRRARARAVLTLRKEWTRHVASAAIERVVHRVDALRAARRFQTRAERVEARVSGGAYFVASAAIERVGRRIDARSAAVG